MVYNKYDDDDDDSLRDINVGKPQEGWPIRLYISAGVIVLASFLSGWHTSVLNTAITEGDSTKKGALNIDLELSQTQHELATGLTIMGAAIASFASFVPRSLGYRKSLYLAALLYIGGNIFTMFATLGMLLTGRILVGMGAGLTGITAPVLLAEIAPPAIRGRITGLHQLGITIGILFSGVLGYALVSYVNHGWRILFGLGLVAPVLQCVLGLVHIPESPRWLLRNDTREAASLVLKNLRPHGFNVDKELSEMEADAAKEAEQRASVSWSALIRPEYRRCVVVGIGMLFFSCFTGINSVVFYSSQVFEFAGTKDPLFSTVLVFTLNVVVTLVCVFTIDRLGRQILLICGSSMMVVALSTMGGVLYFSASAAAGYVAVVCLLVFMGGFAIAWGGVGFTIVGEVVPNGIRAKVFSISTTINWIGNLFLSLMVLTLIEAFGGGSSHEDRRRGVAILYWIFAAISIVSWFFAVMIVPETKGRSLEELEEMIIGAPLCGPLPEKHNTERVALLQRDHVSHHTKISFDSKE